MRQTSPEISKDKLIVTSEEVRGKVKRKVLEGGIVVEFKYGEKVEPEKILVMDDRGETLYYADLVAWSKIVQKHDLLREQILNGLFASATEVIKSAQQEKLKPGKMAEA